MSRSSTFDNQADLHEFTFIREIMHGVAWYSHQPSSVIPRAPICANELGLRIAMRRSQIRYDLIGAIFSCALMIVHEIDPSPKNLRTDRSRFSKPP